MVRWFTLLVFSSCCTMAFSQISIHPRVETSTIVGVAPMPLFLDATASTVNNDLISTFHDLHYQWNFGDFYSGVWNTIPKSKNRATAPLAAHVFDSVGLHVIELEVFQNSEYSVLKPITIKIQNPNDFYAGEKTICFSTSGDFADVPYAAKKVKINEWAEVEPYLADSVRILFRRGDTIPALSGLDLSGFSRLTIGAYGHRLKINTLGVSSNAPVVVMEGEEPLIVVSPADTLQRNQHLKITELYFFNKNNNNTSSAILAEGAVQNNLMYRLKIDGFAQPVHYQVKDKESKYQFEEIVIADCLINNSSQEGDLVEMNGRKIAVIGNQLDNHLQAGDVLSIHWAEKAVISSNRLNNAGKNKHCFDFSPWSIEKNSTNLSIANQIIVSDNYFETDGAVKEIIRIGKFYAYQQEMKDVIIDRNYIHAIGGRKVKVGMMVSADNMTIKNNIINGTGGNYRRFTGIWVRHPSDSVYISNINITNNTIFKKEWVDLMTGIRIDKNIAYTFVANNLVYSPDAMDLRIVFNEGNFTTDERNIYPYVHPFIAEEPTQPIDFQLDSVSLVLDNGIEIPCAFRDFLEKERSNETRIDIGAFQFTSNPITNYSTHELNTSDLHAFPYKKRSYFTMDLSKFTSSYDVEIFNAEGDIIHADHSLRDMFFTWETQPYENGIYWLKISSKNATTMTKIFINRK